MEQSYLILSIVFFSTGAFLAGFFLSDFVNEETEDHHWWHEIFFVTSESSSYRKHLSTGPESLLEDYSYHLKKCYRCKQWKIKIADYKRDKFLERIWEPREKAVKWLNDNEYNN